MLMILPMSPRESLAQVENFSKLYKSNKTTPGCNFCHITVAETNSQKAPLDDTHD